MIYHRPYPIEFNHCDPAGIVFYPRYFEMTNHVCENFFREIVGVSYGQMMAEVSGVPTVQIEASFRAPSRLGDVLEVSLDLQRLGASSATFLLTARCQGQDRMSAVLTLVFVRGVDGVPRPTPWPEAMREKMASFQSA